MKMVVNVAAMKKFDYAILFIIQFCITLWLAHYQTIPGNIDADYYFMGGVRLAQGHGFTENYIWNYFSDPVSLPQPSHAYWMPLASILTALGMWLTGNQSFAAGRLAFILFVVLIPPLTASLSYRMTHRRDLAILSGLLALCSGFYLPYLPVTENYSVFMVLGALYFLNLDRNNKYSYLLLGILSGLTSLARSDGILWLFLTFLLIVMDFIRNRNPLHLDSVQRRLSKPKRDSASINFFLTLSGFLIIMLPWYLRNLKVFGAPMSIAARRALWLTEYYQTFIYPADGLTFANWLASGWSSILAARLSALERVFSNIITVQGAIVLLPFILIGIWKLRDQLRVRLGLLAWGLLILSFTIIFPFASMRGSYIHAVCTIQPLLWVTASVGFDALIQSLQKRRMFQWKGLGFIFQSALVLVMAFVSYSSVNALVLSNGWQRGELIYPTVEAFLTQQNIAPDEPVMVINPPGYTMMTGRAAVMFPSGGEQSVLGVAKQFGARYIVLKADTANPNAHFNVLYDNPNLYSSTRLIGEVDDVRIFKVIVLP
jgi:hypothetical protein